MYRRGHQGMALILYAPIGLVLVVTDLVSLAIAGGVLSVSLASLPDIDQRLSGIKHRGVTHTLLFAVAVGGILAGVGWLVGREYGVTETEKLAAFGGVVGTTAIVSHLVADTLTPMGITPFWPVSGRHYTLDIVRADNRLANDALLILGIVTVGVGGVLAEAL